MKEQIEENLEKIRSEQWLNEFPTGANLLTYLFRIMIASEADLQVIDLLRRIFTQTVRPILLMISEFITIGSFEDPFNEFFVEKLYRNQQTDSPEADDLIYKLTSDPSKIPVFLQSKDSAITIFKIGCDLNLLKKKRKQIVTDSGQHFESVKATTKIHLPDYFAICSKGDSSVTASKKLAMVDHASRMLSLDFSMQRLQEKQVADSRLFREQADMLQAIERQIAKEETDALL